MKRGPAGTKPIPEHKATLPVARPGPAGRLHRWRLPQPAAVAVPDRAVRHTGPGHASQRTGHVHPYRKPVHRRLRFARSLLGRGRQLPARHGLPERAADGVGRKPRSCRRGKKIHDRSAAQREKLVSGHELRRRCPPIALSFNFLDKGNRKVTQWEDAPDCDQNAEHLVKEEKPSVRQTRSN